MISESRPAEIDLLSFVSGEVLSDVTVRLFLPSAAALPVIYAQLDDITLRAIGFVSMYFWLFLQYLGTIQVIFRR